MEEKVPVGEEKKENKIVGGLAWSFGERITAQLVTTIVSIILARILEPEHYGIISLVTVFITVCNVFVTSGFNSAVVRAKEADEKDYNTAFWMGFILSIVLYGVLFVSAPAIAKFYGMELLNPVIRVMGLRLPIASINSIQQAYVRRKMIFKKFFLATLFGTVLSGLVGIGMAVAGFGVWALVGQYMTNTTADTIVLWIVCGWKPKFEYSRGKAKSIFSFGWKVLLTDMVSTLENDIRSLIIGKVFSPADLAFFDQGKKFPALIVNNLNTSINKVMLPAYSQKQDDLAELKRMLRKSIKIGAFILSPLLIGFAAVSSEFVMVVFKEKWLFAIPYIKVFCIVYLTRPLETACHQALLAIGRSDIALKIMIAINSLALVTVLIATFGLKSVFLIAIGSLLTTILSLILFMFYTKKMLDYKTKEQLCDILPPLLSAFVMYAAVKAIGCISVNPLLLLLMEVVCGGAVYLGCAFLTKNEILFQLLEKMNIKKQKK